MSQRNELDTLYKTIVEYERPEPIEEDPGVTLQRFCQENPIPVDTSPENCLAAIKEANHEEALQATW